MADSNSSLMTVRGLLARALGYSHGGRRDLYEVFGYDRQLTVKELFAMYSRNDIANRIVRAFPEATWRQGAPVRDEAGDGVSKGASHSPFAEAFEDFCERHGALQALERADRLASIGRFGVLFMGFRDGKDPREPLAPGKAPLLYLQPYGEHSTTVERWNASTGSERFGKPEVYRIQTGGVDGVTGAGLSSAPIRSFSVHHSRVLHLAEFLEEDETFGLPRLQPIFNRLKDLEKVVGGAAETFWLTANRGLALWGDKDGNLGEDDIKSIRNQLEEFQHQFRRTLVGSGMTAQVLGSESPDPEPNATILLDLIAGATGIPKRILIGSERGELSSEQDENNWAARIDARRKNFAGPSIIRPFVERMIDTGNLPMPQGEYWVEWPKMASSSETEKAAVAVSKAGALATYVNAPGAEFIVPKQEFRRDILGLPPESEYEAEGLDDADMEEGEPEPEGADLEGVDIEGEDADADGGETHKEPSANAKPRTLYVFRRVLNAAAIVAWARKQGFKTTLPADEMHVTIAWSRATLDWMKVPQAWGQNPETGNLVIPKGGPRLVEPLGDAGAVVLLFSSADLQHRHAEIVAAGASHDYPEYQPHVTLTYEGEGVDLSGVKPYQGQIILGPEEFREIDEDWKASME